MDQSYLTSVKSIFLQYKKTGEQAMAQIPDERLIWQHNPDSNSVATIVKHLSGNMISRWTDFLTTDGEKKNRNRDEEFVNDIKSRAALMACWNKGWNCFETALNSIREEDLERIIYIRAEAHTVQRALNRQLAHYPYHVGQIVFIAKMYTEEWKSLSIPKKKT